MLVAWLCQARAVSGDELAAFLTERDMQGPAAHLRSNGVSGEDFLGFSENDLREQLRVLPFVAAKLLLVRRTFVESAP